MRLHDYSDAALGDSWLCRVVGRIYEYAILSKPSANRNRRSTSHVYEIPSFPSMPARALAEGPIKGFHLNPFILLTQTLLRSDAYCRCRGSLGCLSKKKKVGPWGYPTSSLSSSVGHFDASCSQFWKRTLKTNRPRHKKTTLSSRPKQSQSQGGKCLKHH